MLRRPLASPLFLAALTGIAATLACASGPPERVSYDTLASVAEGRTMDFAVYTPPGWDQVTPLPLVVFLHGGGDDQTVLEQHTVIVETFDEWIAAGKLDPFILVAPNGDRGLWTNWRDGSHAYEDYVVDEIIPTMRERYPIAPGRENLHLMGISMGGAGTIYTTIHQRELFASATLFSAPLFDVDQTLDFVAGKRFRGIPVDRIFGNPDRATVEASNPYAVLQGPEDLRGTKLLVGVGRSDIPGLLPLNRQFHAHLEAQAIPHHYLEYRGGHGWRAWARLFPVALCLHMRGGACELEPERFYSLERDPRLDSLERDPRVDSGATQ